MSITKTSKMIFLRILNKQTVDVYCWCFWNYIIAEIPVSIRNENGLSGRFSPSLLQKIS